MMKYKLGKNSYIFFCVFLFSGWTMASKPSLAVSFDCAKANTHVEKLICSDVKLSEMDNTLNLTYHASLENSENASDLRREQKRWIVDARNTCKNTKCLSEAYSVRIFQLKENFAESERQCSVDASKIIGSWQRVKGGDFQEFALAREEGKKSFTSWLHHRPEFAGTWEIKECKLYVKNEQNQELDFEYRILGYRDKILYLKSSDDESQSSYRKIH